MSRPSRNTAQATGGTASVLDLMSCLIGCLVLLLLGIVMVFPLVVSAGKKSQWVDYHTTMPGVVPGFKQVAPESLHHVVVFPDRLAEAHADEAGQFFVGERIRDINGWIGQVVEQVGGKPHVVLLIAPNAGQAGRSLRDALAKNPAVSLGTEPIGSRQLCVRASTEAGG